MEEELITTQQLCEWLKVSKATASNWRNEGLPCYGSNRTFRYKKSEVLQWLSEKRKTQKWKEVALPTTEISDFLTKQPSKEFRLAISIADLILFRKGENEGGFYFERFN